MPQMLFTPGKDPVPLVQKARWAPGPVWTGAENLTPTGIQSLNRPAHSQLLYRLRYPAHTCIGNGCYLGTAPSPTTTSKKQMKANLSTTWTGEKLSRMTFNKISSSWGSNSVVCQTICMELIMMSCSRNVRKKLFPIIKVLAVTN